MACQQGVLVNTFTLLVFRDRVESSEGSLSGRIKTVVPEAFAERVGEIVKTNYLEQVRK